MASDEVARASLGLYLNSKPLTRQMGALQGKLENSLSSLGAKLGRTLGAALSIAAVTKFAKSCIDLGSDLAEVQNVVDVTFSTMSARVDEFARNAAATFGLSETMAKQFTGTFGAMAKAFGFSESAAYDMSTALTGLAGDVASFYNLEQEEAFTKLKAIFTGETEGLKSLGVVMTQTALDQFALENGFGKTTSAMTEQEKTALRYQFVLDKLSLASGDFARTSDGWANQTRLLRLQYEQLQATMGQGIIAALTPAIQALNRFMGALVKAANTFKAFVYALMGKKSEDMAAGAGAVSDALGDISAGAGAASDSLDGVGGSASGAAKALKRSLAGFDQITKLTEQSSGSGGGGGSGGGVGGLGDLGDTASALISEAWDAGGESPLARMIRDAWTNGDWQEVGTLIGEKFNDLIENIIPWETLGINVGKSINALFGVQYWTLDEINFTNLGDRIAEFVNSAISHIDFDIAGRLPVEKLTSIIDVLGGFLGTLDWGQIGRSISDFLDGALDETNNWFEGVDWNNVGNQLYAKMDAFISNVDYVSLAKKMGRLLKNAVTAGGSLWEGFYDALAEDWNESFESFSNDVDAKMQNNKLGDWLRKWFEPDEEGNNGLKNAIDAWFISVENWFIGSWNSFVDGLMSADWGLANILKDKLELENLKLEPVEIPAKADLQSAVDNIPASDKDISSTVMYDKWKYGPGKDHDYFGVWSSTVQYDKWKYGPGRNHDYFSVWSSTAMFTNKAFGGGKTIDDFTVWGSTARFISYIGLTYTPTIDVKAQITSATAKDGIVVSGGLKLQTKALGGVFAGGRWSPIQRYAAGGTPGMGQLFMAREAGPELVGTLGGHTAVMNNDQIVASVSAGVARAVAGIKFYSRERYTPHLAVIGQSVSRTEQHLAAIEQHTSPAAGGKSQEIELLRQILAAVVGIDPDVYLDGVSVKDRVVALINQNTQANGGVCEIIV